jgi:membrane protein implicated in regulation of membrane protease activity
MTTPGALGGMQLGLASAAVLLSLWSSAHITVFYTIPALVAGVLLGHWAGTRTSAALARQFADTGRIVLYSEDTPLYAAVLPLLAAISSPVVFAWTLFSIWTSPGMQTLVPLILCFVSAAWLSHDLSLARNLWLLTERIGTIPIQWFHARSIVGPEGAIGQRAIVLVDCAPDGYVRLQGERWRARSADGLPLRTGQPVEVQQLDGLMLIVRAAPEFREDA